MQFTMAFDHVISGADPKTVCSALTRKALEHPDVIRHVDVSKDARTVRLRGARLGGSGEGTIRLRSRGGDTLVHTDLTLRIPPPWDRLVPTIDLKQRAQQQIDQLIAEVQRDVSSRGREVA